MKTTIDGKQIKLEIEERKKCKHCGRYNTYVTNTSNFDLGDMEHFKNICIPLLKYLEEITDFLKETLGIEKEVKNRCDNTFPDKPEEEDRKCPDCGWREIGIDCGGFCEHCAGKGGYGRFGDLE